MPRRPTVRRRRRRRRRRCRRESRRAERVPATSRHHEHGAFGARRSLVHASYPASTPQGHAGMIARWTRQRSSSLGAVRSRAPRESRSGARHGGSSARTRRIGTRRGRGGTLGDLRARTRRGTRAVRDAHAGDFLLQRAPRRGRRRRVNGRRGASVPFEGPRDTSLRLFAGAPRRLRPRRGRSSWHSQTGLWTRRGRGAAR